MANYGLESFQINQFQQDLQKQEWVKVKVLLSIWAPVNSGKILFELGDLPDDLSREALRLASHKLALKTKIVSRSEQF